MRTLVASVALGSAILLSSGALAADPVRIDYPVYKDFIPPHIPPVDHGLKGSFYLRGSAAGNVATAREINHPTLTPSTYDVDSLGYGYSAGIGFGWESGTGLRTDVTVDYLVNNGMAIDILPGTTGTVGDPVPGEYSLNLRSTIALANAYYDFGLSGQGLSAAGGPFGYVGAGIGVAFSEASTDEPGGITDAFPGMSTSLAAAGYAGVGYDFGAVVADLGYRALYINSIENNAAPASYSIDDVLLHELRATVRYRF